MTMQLEPITLTVADAEAAVAAAERDRADIEGRIRAGDPDATSDDVAKADAAVRFARLRLDLAKQQEAARAEQERRDQIAEVQRRLADPARSEALAKARRAFERAVDAFAAACADYDSTHSEIYMDAIRHEMPGVRTVSGTDSIVTPKGTYHRSRLQEVIVEVATTAIRQHYGPRAQITLNTSTMRR